MQEGKLPHHPKMHIKTCLNVLSRLMNESINNPEKTSGVYTQRETNSKANITLELNIRSKMFELFILFTLFKEPKLVKLSSQFSCR
jgi:hypothetical protein